MGLWTRHRRRDFERVALDRSLDRHVREVSEGLLLDGQLELITVDPTVEDRRIAEWQTLGASDLAARINLQLVNVLDFAHHGILGLRDPGSRDIRGVSYARPREGKS